LDPPQLTALGAIPQAIDPPVQDELVHFLKDPLLVEDHLAGFEVRKWHSFVVFGYEKDFRRAASRLGWILSTRLDQGEKHGTTDGSDHVPSFLMNLLAAR
jgi:hypothetical protein